VVRCARYRGALFAFEYGVKLWLAPERWLFIRTHKLDLAMVVLPMLRPLRALRALRMLRGGTVLGDSLERTKRVLTHKGLHIVLLSVVVIVFAAAALEIPFEAHTHAPTAIHTFGQALWWAVVTVTTVGYGDRIPQTAAGQGVAVVLMLVGIGLVGVLTATIASFFVSEQRSDTDAKVDAMREQLDRMEAALALLRVQSAPGESATPPPPTEDVATGSLALEEDDLT